jgi:hypothetical protein
MKPVEKNRGPGYESTQLCPLSYVLTKMPKIYDGEKRASSTNFTGKSGYLPSEN